MRIMQPEKVPYFFLYLQSIYKNCNIKDTQGHTRAHKGTQGYTRVHENSKYIFLGILSLNSKIRTIRYILHNDYMHIGSDRTKLYILLVWDEQELVKFADSFFTKRVNKALHHKQLSIAVSRKYIRKCDICKGVTYSCMSLCNISFTQEM